MKRKTTIIYLIVFFIGLSLLLYPVLSNHINSIHSTEAVTKYSEAVDHLSDEQYQNMILAAREYNLALLNGGQSLSLSEEAREQYQELLNLDGTGMMGYIKIPKINVGLPIYHGTDEAVLQSAVGHLEWTSLPVGGEGTHAVLSGHRGLTSAKLFTDLNQLKTGDTFFMIILNEIYTYEVDQIETVLPEEIDSLMIKNGEDRCTLFTCTPYGINSHRLLVHGHRVENKSSSVISSEAVQIKPIIMIPFLVIFFLLMIFVQHKVLLKLKFF